MKILIADDDLTSRSLLGKMLLDWGYEFDVASDGNEAYEVMCREDSPDLVLLDWIMPGMDGIDVCRKYRNSDNPGIKYIVLLTVKRSMADLLEGFSAGADDYISKPYDNAELQARIKVGARIITLQKQQARDIVELQETKERLEHALHQKDLLMAELHHRVKNNLNIINGMLHFDINSLPEDKTRKAFVDAQVRIHSMAKIYENLHDSVNFISVDMDIYLRDLVISIFATYCSNKPDVKLDISIAKVRTETKKAVLVGLITNELITNIIKYAYNDTSSGPVSVTLAPSGESYLLTVADKGVGLPADFDMSDEKHMGYRLMKMFAQQLEGSLAVQSAPGKGTEVFVTVRI